MATFNVHAPEADYAGTVGGVQFADGKAVIDGEANPSELAYCQNAGYHVEETAPAEAPASNGKPAVNANKDAWLDYAVAKHEADRTEAEKLTKAQLVEWVNAREGDDQ
jgi:hypothetical protein